MAWSVVGTSLFEEWFIGLDESDCARIEDRVDLLEQLGQSLARPVVDTIKASRHHNMKELRTGMVCQDMPAVERLGALLKQKLGPLAFDTVLAPAMGGLVIGQEVARQGQSRFIFAEKENNVLVLRRGFTFRPGERVLVVEDVITRGGRVQECLEIVRKMGGTTVAVAVLVDRSSGQAKFAVPTYALLEMSYPTYPADQLPPELAKLPASKPGS